MLIQLDPHDLLAGVHIDLVRVAQAASQSPQPFRIVYGLRTPEAEAEAVRTGHSQTLHSRHLADARYAGKAMAFDFACLDDTGQIDWTVADANGGRYGRAAGQILTAAQHLADAGVIRKTPGGQPGVQWGGLAVGAWVDGVVSHFRDWGHIQLDPSAYPA